MHLIPTMQFRLPRMPTRHDPHQQQIPPQSLHAPNLPDPQLPILLPHPELLSLQPRLHPQPRHLPLLTQHPVSKLHVPRPSLHPMQHPKLHTMPPGLHPAPQPLRMLHQQLPKMHRQPILLLMRIPLHTQLFPIRNMRPHAGNKFHMHGGGL